MALTGPRQPHMCACCSAVLAWAAHTRVTGRVAAPTTATQPLIKTQHELHLDHALQRLKHKLGPHKHATRSRAQMTLLLPVALAAVNYSAEYGMMAQPGTHWHDAPCTLQVPRTPPCHTTAPAAPPRPSAARSHPRCKSTRVAPGSTAQRDAGDVMIMCGSGRR